MADELLDILSAAGKLDEPAVERVRGVRQATGERTDVIVTRLGLAAEEDVAAALAAALGLPIARTDSYPVEPVLVDRVTREFLHASRVLPLEDAADALILAMADPLDHYALDAIRLLVGKPVEARVAVPGELVRALDRLYGNGVAKDAGSERPSPGLAESYAADVARLRDQASEAPVVRLVNELIAEAVAARASDIHLEPYQSRLRTRLRVDGVLREQPPVPPLLRSAIANRIKIMASLNIAEQRLPQDGRITANVRGREIDIRVSTVPNLGGESIVLRILDAERTPLALDALGLSEDVAGPLAQHLALANGIVLVTGPTGSGKTTTLYAALQLLNTPDRNVLTVEDPVEYELPGINQIQVKPQIGLTFAHSLRSMLRHDPDVMMVGEIRDRETAEISVQAALTGHLVLSTLHTNDAASTLARLLDMKVEAYLLASSLRAILAQRLVRKLCLHCRSPYRASPEQADYPALEDAAAGAAGPTLYRANGCERCAGTGYTGRTAIAEFLPITDAIRRLILRQADDSALRQAARQDGMRAMRQDGMLKAAQGITSVEEVLRVTQMG